MTSAKIRNMNLVRVTWNGVSFDCTAKELPSLKEASSWTIVTDNNDELTGRTIVGKPGGFSPFQLSIETDLELVYDTLLNAYINGTVSSATFVYTPPNGTTSTLTVPKCSLCGIETEKVSSGNSITVIKLQPEGGETANMPSAN